MSSVFRPSGINSPSPVRNSTRERRDYPRDRLMIVEGYDLNRRMVYGKEITIDGDGGQLEVTLRPREKTGETARDAAKPRDGKAIKWTGSSIDPNMAEELPPGSWIICESTLGANVETRGGKKVTTLTSSWIKNCPDKKLEKTFPAIITANAYKDVVQRFQAHDQQSISASNQEAVEAFASELDRLAQETKDGKNPIRKGFRFRVLRRTKDAKGNDPGEKEFIDLTPLIEWISDGEGAESTGHPVTGAEFKQYIADYTDHIWGSEAWDSTPGSDEEKIDAGLVPPKFDAATLNQIELEITTYRSFKAGSPDVNDGLVVREPEAGRPGSPLFNMVSTPSRLSISSEDLFRGRNYGVIGIIRLTGDSFDRETNTINIRNLVASVALNGPRGSVDNFIPSVDGARVRPAPGMELVVRRAEVAKNEESSTEDNDGLLQAPPGDALAGVGGESSPFEASGDVFNLDATPAAPAPAAPAPEAPAQAAAPTSTSRPRRGGVL